MLDNGRSEMLGTREFREVLRCIRCGACMNHCPVYNAVGGHAYGWVYPGPIGAVLTPALLGVEEAGHLPNASTFCGRCEEVCPMKIPLPELMRRIGAKPNSQPAAAARHTGTASRHGRASHGGRASITRSRALGMAACSARSARRRGGFRWLPLRQRLDAASRLPAPQGRTFQQLWAEHQEGRAAMSRARRSCAQMRQAPRTLAQRW